MCRLGKLLYKYLGKYKGEEEGRRTDMVLSTHQAPIPICFPPPPLSRSPTCRTDLPSLGSRIKPNSRVAIPNRDWLSSLPVTLV